MSEERKQTDLPTIESKRSLARNSARLAHLKIRNYKGIDSLDLDFPLPDYEDEPDIFVIGSENGGGKTSILECCAFLRLCASLTDSERKTLEFDPALVASGSSHSRISATFEAGALRSDIEISIHRDGASTIKPSGDRHIFRPAHKERSPERFRIQEELIPSILSVSSEPVVEPGLLHFNSFRKVQEAKPEIGALVDRPNRDHSQRAPRANRSRYLNGSGSTLSQFKSYLLRAMISQSKFFSRFDDSDGRAEVDRINALLREFCNVEIGQIQPSQDNRLDIRVRSLDGKQDFSLDQLSSGQKEIISTLFLIGSHTASGPALVLIDEPELHLNTQWQSPLLRKLESIAPQNQYILATHSEAIFDAVHESRRLLITRSARKVD